MPQPLQFQIKITGLAQAKAQVAAALQNAAPGGTIGGGGAGTGGSSNSAGSALGGFGSLYLIRHVFNDVVNAFLELTRAAEDASTNILNIRDTLGSTFGQAAGLNSLFTTAGMSGMQGERLAERVSKDQLSPSSMGMMNMLGIRQGKNGADTLTNIISGLRGIQDSSLKAADAIQILGMRGYSELLPILRMTDDIYAQTQQMGEAWKQQYTDKVEGFKEQVSLLGQTFLVDVAAPLMTAVIPAIITLFHSFEGLFMIFSKVNDMFGGVPAYAVAFGALAGGIALASYALLPMIKSMQIMVGLQAAWNALSGNWANIAAAVGVGAAVGIGFSLFNDQGDKLDEIADNTKKTANALIDLSVNSIGGGGRLGNIVASQIQAEYAFRNATKLGG